MPHRALLFEQSCDALEALLATEGTSVVMPWPESMLAQVDAHGELLTVSLVPGYPAAEEDGMQPRLAFRKESCRKY
jgi:hypothetical protein